MTILALLGATALWLTYAWLLSAIVASYLSHRKGYGERPGLASGLLLTVLGVVIWLVVPPKPEPVAKLENARKILVVGDFFAGNIGGELETTFEASPLRGLEDVLRGRGDGRQMSVVDRAAVHLLGEHAEQVHPRELARRRGSLLGCHGDHPLDDLD